MANTSPLRLDNLISGRNVKVKAVVTELDAERAELGVVVVEREARCVNVLRPAVHEQNTEDNITVHPVVQFETDRSVAQQTSVGVVVVLLLTETQINLVVTFICGTVGFVDSVVSTGVRQDTLVKASLVPSEHHFECTHIFQKQNLDIHRVALRFTRLAAVGRFFRVVDGVL